MNRGRIFTVFLALAVSALLIATPWTSPSAQESPAQVTMQQKFVNQGVQAKGAGVALHGELGTLSAAVASATRTQVVAAPAAGVSTILRGVLVESATAATGVVTISYGTGTNCATSPTVITSLAAGTSTVIPIGYVPLNVVVPAAKAVCITTDAATTSARVSTQ